MPVYSALGICFSCQSLQLRLLGFHQTVDYCATQSGESYGPNSKGVDMTLTSSQIKSQVFFACSRTFCLSRDRLMSIFAQVVWSSENHACVIIIKLYLKKVN